MSSAGSVYLRAYLAFGQSLGNHGLWIALLTFMVARGLVQWLFFWRKGLGLR